jgi:hypothetical protein
MALEMYPGPTVSYTFTAKLYSSGSESDHEIKSVILGEVSGENCQTLIAC